MRTLVVAHCHGEGVLLRAPYVGTCAGGARRSAQIDREEADVLPGGAARDDRLVSAEQWERQADWFDLHLVPIRVKPGHTTRLDPMLLGPVGPRSVTNDSAPSGAAMTRQNPDQAPAAGEGS